MERAASVLGDHVGQVAHVHEIEPYKAVNVGEYAFTPVTAIHMPDDLCVNYIVQSGGWTASTHAILVSTLKKHGTSSRTMPSM